MSEPNFQTILKRVILAEDEGDEMERLASMHAARLALGFKLEQDEHGAIVDVLVANGYDENGQPIK